MQDSADSRSLRNPGRENLNPNSTPTPSGLNELHDGAIYGFGEHNLSTSSFRDVSLPQASEISVAHPVRHIFGHPGQPR
ncbi:hypothetical protein V2G26_015565 [Clonostachys chloroleuca]